MIDDAFESKVGELGDGIACAINLGWNLDHGTKKEEANFMLWSKAKTNCVNVLQAVEKRVELDHYTAA